MLQERIFCEAQLAFVCQQSLSDKSIHGAGRVICRYFIDTQRDNGVDGGEDLSFFASKVERCHDALFRLYLLQIDAAAREGRRCLQHSGQGR